MRPKPVSFKNWLKKFRPRVEALEDRSVPAVSVVQSGSLLTITGSAGANTVHITDNGDIGVVGDGVDKGEFSGVETITILLRGGADILTYDVTDDIGRDLGSATRHITANLGGEGDMKANSFTFDTNGNPIFGMDITLDIIGGGKSDTRSEERRVGKECRL